MAECDWPNIWFPDALHSSESIFGVVPVRDMFRRGVCNPDSSVEGTSRFVDVICQEGIVCHVINKEVLR